MPNDQLPKGELMTLLALPLPASCLEMKEGRIQLGQCLYEVVLKYVHITHSAVYLFHIFGYLVLLGLKFHASRQETKSNLATFGEFDSFFFFALTQPQV